MARVVVAGNQRRAADAVRRWYQRAAAPGARAPSIVNCRVGTRNPHLLEDTGTDVNAGLPMAKPGSATTLPIASTIATATRAIPTRTARATPIKATTAQDSDKATKKGTGKPPGNSPI